MLACRVVAADWFAYQSDSFTVYSDLPEEDVAGALENFELFRYVALQTLALPDVPEHERLRIVMFGNELDFQLFQPAANVGGFFYHAVHGPRMLIGPQRGAGANQQTLFHEYVHYLMNRHSDVNYPMWYSEGLAQLLETTSFDDSTVVVGTPPLIFEQVKAVFPKYRPLRVKNLIDLKQRENPTDFYTTAWLMVHYLLLGSVGDATRMEQTADFLLRYDAGEDPLEAFDRSYGISVRDMDKAIMAYSDDRMFHTLVFPQMAYEGNWSAREMRPSETAYLLGDIAVELGRVGVAYLLFDEFAAEAEDPEFAPRIEAARAIALIHEGRTEEADALMADLIAGAGDDVEILTDIAHFEYDRHVVAIRDDDADGETHLRRSIDFAARAILADPGNVEARYFLGLDHELDGNLSLATQTLYSIYVADPSMVEVSLALARMLVKQRNRADARYFLERAYSSVHDEDEREQLREIQLQIEDPSFDVGTIDELL